VAQIDLDRNSLHRESQRLDQPMRYRGEAITENELVEQRQGAGMHGVPTEITQEIGMLLQHGDIHTRPGQQQAQHHPCRPAADDHTPGGHGYMVAPKAAALLWFGVGGFLSWWDGVELWLSGLGFLAQTAIVMPIVLVLAYGIAVVLDGALGNGIRQLRRALHKDEEPS
jgi:hypothetical protein